MESFSPYNIHPLFIHFPIALLASGFFFDILYKFTNNNELDHAAFWCLGLGIISCLFANITGLFAFLSEASLIEFFKFTHGILAWGITLIYMIIFWLKIKFQLDLQFSNVKKNIFFFIQLMMIIILFYMAHIGATGEREWLF